MGSRRRPEPVVDAQKITAAVLGIIGGTTTLLAAFGVIVTDDTKQAITSTLVGMITLVGIILPITQAYVSRSKVTPLSDPRDADGVPLKPVGKHREESL